MEATEKDRIKLEAHQRYQIQLTRPNATMKFERTNTTALEPCRSGIISILDGKHVDLWFRYGLDGFR